MDRILDATAFTGYSLADTRARLGAVGAPVVCEVEVSPPGDFSGSGDLRVIKVASDSSGVRVYYAHRTYHRTPREKTESDLPNPLV